MEATTVNKIAELYKIKSDLLGELSHLVNIEEYSFAICRAYKGGFLSSGSYVRYTSVSSSFLAEIKKLTEAHIKQQIEEIDKELEEL